MWVLHPSNARDQWYANIRARLRRLHTNRVIAEGEWLVDQAPPIYRTSVRQVMAALFYTNTTSAMEERDLIVTQWHCMRKASKMGIRHSAVKFIGAPTGALRFEVGRAKTNLLQLVDAFCDAESWEADIFHTKACHFLTSNSVVVAVQFREASASVINRILTRVCVRTAHWNSASKATPAVEVARPRRSLPMAPA